MSPNRFAKMLVRRVKVSWRDQPNRYDIEAMQANTRRVGLVIRVRWALVAALALFSVFAAGAYAAKFPWGSLWPNMLIPAFAMVFVLLYNTYYQLTYRYLGNIAILNHAQLLFDATVVTVLVYYSGGAHSWFWAMYPLFVLEAAFILPTRRDVWLISAACMVMVGFVFWGEYFGLLPHVQMPFVGSPLHGDFTFVSVRYLWQITVLAGAATVGSLMTSAIRRREAELASASIVDDATGLYDRRYFLRALNSEVMRADHDARQVHIVLVDIDGFGEFNRLVGLDAGDRMLKKVADSVSSAMNDGGRGEFTGNVASRYGGEEFALILTELPDGTSPERKDALLLAEELRASVESLREKDASVTISVGVASFPADAGTADGLLDAADEALQEAKSAGGNGVRTAAEDGLLAGSGG